MTLSQHQLFQLIELNRYTTTEITPLEGQKPLTLGLFLMELHKAILEKDKTIEELKKKNALSSLALSNYSKDEKDEIIKELGDFLVKRTDWRGSAIESKYVGSLLEKKTGKLTISGGAYEGETVGGEPNGKGVLDSKDGNRYTGEFMHGVPSGKGKLEMKTGAKYEGEFRHGQFQGWGVFQYADGGVYTGTFNKGKKNGLGVLKSGTGDIQIGFFQEDLNHGICVQITSDFKHTAVENYVNDVKEGSWRLYSLHQSKSYSHGEEVKTN